MRQRSKLPLVYSCSGASSAAQMANHIAVKLDCLKIAEMSCIAGVGGDVKPLVRKARSGRPIIIVDGCPLHCAAQILKRHGLRADKHYDLSLLGVKTNSRRNFDPELAAQILRRIQLDLAPASPPGNAVSKPHSGLPVPADEESREPSSPPCYLNEFKDW